MTALDLQVTVINAEALVVEAGKTYVIQCGTRLSADVASQIVRMFETKTGAKCVVVDRDLRVLTEETTARVGYTPQPDPGGAS